jgi:NADH-quinone oxidoreductase subunit N
MKMNEFCLLMPELILILGALVLLPFGAFFAKNDSNRVLLPSLFVLAISALSICWLDKATEFAVVNLLNDFLIINGYVIFAKYMIVIAAFLVSIMYLPWARNKEQAMPFEVPILILLATAGASFLVAANNLLSLYLSLELMSLSLYVLVAIQRSNPLSAEAGLKYFILGALSSGLFLFGTSLIYGMVGSINFPIISEYYYSMAITHEAGVMPLAFVLGMLMVLIAFFFKISAAPFHMWAPDVYQGAPTAITAYLATVPKLATILLLLRLLFKVFASFNISLQPIIYIVCLTSLFVGSFGAIMQKNIKRLLAYSSIGHIGFALIGVVSGQIGGVKAVLLYMIIYLIMTLGAFACLLLLNNKNNDYENTYDLAGLSHEHPYLAAAISILMFSMAGIPPLAGFFAKFYVLYAAIQADFLWLAVFGVVASVISAFYYLNIIKIIYFDEVKRSVVFDSCCYLKVMILLTSAFNLLFVTFPTKFLLLAEISASWLV